MLRNEFAVKVRSQAYVAMPKLIADHLQVGCLKQFIDSECMPQPERVDAGEFLFKPILEKYHLFIFSALFRRR
jgi:hypothetical protein